MSKLRYSGSRERQWGDDNYDDIPSSQRTCIVLGEDDWGKTVELANCNVESPGLYWDLSGIEKQKIGQIRTVDGKSCLTNNNGRLNVQDCAPGMSEQEFYLSVTGDLRSADSINSRRGRRDRTDRRDGCIGYDQDGKLIFDNSGFGKNKTWNNSPYANDDNSRVCERKFEIVNPPRNVNNAKGYKSSGEPICKDGYYGNNCEYRTCNPLVRGQDLTRECNPNTGEWAPKAGYAPRNGITIKKNVPSSYNLPGENTFTCDPSLKPKGRSVCDEYLQGWRCETNWFGDECEWYLKDEPLAYQFPKDVPELVIEKCMKGYDEEDYRGYCESLNIAGLPPGKVLWNLENRDIALRQALEDAWNEKKNAEYIKNKKMLDYTRKKLLQNRKARRQDANLFESSSGLQEAIDKREARMKSYTDAISAIDGEYGLPQQELIKKIVKGDDKFKNDNLLKQMEIQKDTINYIATAMTKFPKDSVEYKNASAELTHQQGILSDLQSYMVDTSNPVPNVANDIIIARANADYKRLKAQVDASRLSKRTTTG